MLNDRDKIIFLMGYSNGFRDCKTDFTPETVELTELISSTLYDIFDDKKVDVIGIPVRKDLFAYYTTISNILERNLKKC